MKFLSVCSGIEATSSAWAPLGWEAVAFSEIEPFPCAVLAHHYPTVPNYGDMTKFKDWPDHAIDLLCGGTPCQSFSVAVLRKGLDDPRGNLMLTYGAIAAKYRPKWLVWENVPGVLSSNGGRDFGTFLGMLGQLGYGFAYRVLDAQYFGVAQRRRRVFVVGCLGDWRSAAAVLFERHSLSGHPAPSRKAREVAPTIPSRSTAGGGLGTDFDCDGGTICVATGQAGAEIGADMAPTLNCNHEAPYVAHSLRGEGFDTSEDGTVRGTPLVPVSFAIQAGALRTNPNSGPDGVGVQADHAYTLEARAEVQAVCFDTTQITSAANYSNPKAGDPCHPLAAGMHAPAIAFPANLSATQHASTEELSPSLCAVNPTAVEFNMHKSGNAASSMGVADERTDCLRAFEKSPFAVAYTTKLHNTASNNAGKVFEERSTCLDANSPPPALLTAMQVRRLTPEECEALQGFPRGHTLIPWRKKPASECPDGPRYKALGNSWAVPVALWIGERIEAVDSINSMREAA